VDVEVFLPCAASRLVTQKHAERMLKNGLELIVPGANVPFDDPSIFYGTICEYVDNKISVIPDFMANCGMSRTFSYLMQDDAKIDAVAIFDAVSDVICGAIKDVHSRYSSPTGVTARGLEMILERLV
jgi:glutamate dehydrogenase/leucine dehydrogenase